ESSWFNRTILKSALIGALRKFNPQTLIKNPVMFITALGALVTTCVLTHDIYTGQSFGFTLQITLWLWFTVLFANFAEALAEGRGKAQADALKKMRTHVNARYLNGVTEEIVPASALKTGQRVICEAGDIIPADGEVIEGIASVDESAITGESAPVIRESGGDRSAVTGGTRVISDSIVIRVTAEEGHSFLDRMISMVEGANRQKTPNEIALSILLITLTIVFLVVICSLPSMTGYIEDMAKAKGFHAQGNITAPILISLLVCLIPTTIGGLLSAIGISGINRLVHRNVLATSGRAVEAAGDIDVLLLDKTGTITLGNRMASQFIPAPHITPERLAKAAQLASLADETPEGRSIVILAKTEFGIRSHGISPHLATFVPFTALTRMSGVDIAETTDTPSIHIRKGATENIASWVMAQDGDFPDAVRADVEKVARLGGTPLVVAEGAEILGTIYLKDIVKGGIKDRFAHLREMGIRTVMVTGDNPLTAASIAAEAGVDDFIAEATPEMKLQRIREEQSAGHLVAMTGDGTNDAPALAQADVGVAMNTGTQAAREAGNMVDLDSNPTKLIEIVEIGKQLLITRGALTTFSFANDVAKYFAIIPAMFTGLYLSGTMQDGQEGPLGTFNIMSLQSPQSAILSSVIFNALIIIALIPLALKGVTYRPTSAESLLKRNLLIYGLGGLIAPFIGIKLIDIIINAIHLI
ncbi:MAG: potassium-transporting ATPase subunit KdpB, partial [Akkermansia sp.]